MLGHDKARSAYAAGVGRSMRRLVTGAALIALFTAVALSTAVFETVGTVADVLATGHVIHSSELTPATSGAPITILFVGSDKRYLSKDAIDRGDPPHSDTLLLVRLDPGRGQVSVLSVPRDFLVPSFTDGGGTYRDQKINAAYTIGSEHGGTEGGDNLALKVVEQTLPGIKINDIVDLNFQSFIKVVDKIGCVYVNVDHWYYNPPAQSALDDYAAIDVKPGYQPLCGYKALDYVRYRHEDSTFARDARQQDFLRQAKVQLGVSGLLSHYQDVLKSLQGQVSTNITGSAAVLRLLEVLAGALSGPVRSIPFPNQPLALGGGAYQTATATQINQVVRQFVGNLTIKPRLPASPPTHHAHHGHRHVAAPPPVSGLTTTPSSTITQALALATRVPFHVYLPRLSSDFALQGTSDNDYYAYHLKDPGGHEHAAYRITWQDTNAPLGSYYGIEGTDWTDPPLFQYADKGTYNGRQYLLVGNGRHYLEVGWIVGGDLYWISNTIFGTLTNQQMLALADSARSVS